MSERLGLLLISVCIPEGDEEFISIVLASSQHKGVAELGVYLFRFQIAEENRLF